MIQSSVIVWHTAIVLVTYFVLPTSTSEQPHEACSRKQGQSCVESLSGEQAHPHPQDERIKSLSLLQTTSSRYNVSLPDEPSEPDAQIVFQGQLVAENRNEHWDATRQTFESRLYLRRPQWQKSLRCHGFSQDTCEECSGDRDCWTATLQSNTRSLMVSSQDWSHFKNVIHVHCGENGTLSTSVRFKVRDGDLYNGILEAFWDGLEITESNGFEVLSRPLPFAHNGSSQMPTRRFIAKVNFHNPGGHELALDFAPLAIDSYIVLSELLLYMPEQFALCEDSKACLNIFRPNRAGDYELRNNNTLQQICLQAPEPSGTCRQWRNCLNKTEEGTEAKIRSLLEAALDGEAEVALLDEAQGHVSQNEFAKTKTSIESRHVFQNASVKAENSIEDCIDPAVSDPESWECDCFDDMQQRCLEISRNSLDPICIRAQFCEFARVCQTWKATSCGGNEVEATRELLRTRQFGKKQPRQFWKRTAEASEIQRSQHSMEMTQDGKLCE